MKSRKAAKILIKRAKKQPDLYTAQEVLYAKLFRKHERKIDNIDRHRTQRRQWVMWRESAIRTTKTIQT